MQIKEQIDQKKSMFSISLFFIHNMTGATSRTWTCWPFKGTWVYSPVFSWECVFHVV